MTDPIKLEAVMADLKKSAGGDRLTLIIHPGDSSIELWKHDLGQRFMVVLAPFNEEQRMAEVERQGRNALNKMGAICRSKSFQAWLKHAYPSEVALADFEADPETAARDVVKTILSVDTSATIRDDAEVRVRFYRLVEAYEQENSRQRDDVR